MIVRAQAVLDLLKISPDEKWNVLLIDRTAIYTMTLSAVHGVDVDVVDDWADDGPFPYMVNADEIRASLLGVKPEEKVSFYRSGDICWMRRVSGDKQLAVIQTRLPRLTAVFARERPGSATLAVDIHLLRQMLAIVGEARWITFDVGEDAITMRYRTQDGFGILRAGSDDGITEQRPVEALLEKPTEKEAGKWTSDCGS